jgi:hypothetical protein
VAGERATGLVAWVPERELAAPEWAAAGRRIGAVGRGIQWLLGDWIAYGNLKFGERYARASKITGYDRQTLMNMVYVGSRFPISRRRENLSWSHHEALASLGIEEQERWLEQASADRWSVADLRTMLRSSRSRGPAAAVAREPTAAAVEAAVAEDVISLLGQTGERAADGERAAAARRLGSHLADRTLALADPFVAEALLAASSAIAARGPRDPIAA